MATKRRGREPRYTRTVGKPPRTGRRIVENGRVRIEWTTSDGKRRRRTIGPNDAETRARADAQLESLLLEETPMPPSTTNATEVGSALRGAALRILQAADDLVDWFRHPPEDDADVTVEPEPRTEDDTDEGDR